MSYTPNRENESLFISAWSSIDKSLPTSGPDSSPNYTFNIDLKGIGDRVDLSSNLLTTPEGLPAFWVGDIRSQTDSIGDRNYFSIKFENSNGDLSAPVQEQRRSFNGDLAYATYNSAKLILEEIVSSKGDTLALYVRILGILTRG